MNLSESTTKWAKFGLIENLRFVGKDFIGFGRGLYLIFINLITREEYLYRANCDERGNGVSSFGAHKTQTIFAFSEKRPGCRIFVLTCPKFQTISILSSKTDDSHYTWLSFTETDYLLALSDLPDFTLAVWNWRTGKKISEKVSELRATEQTLRSNLTFPIKAVQLERKSRNLYLWDIFTCGKENVMMPHKISIDNTIPFISHIKWSPEGYLMIADHVGNIYTIAPDKSLQLIIKCNEIGDSFGNCCWWKGGILVYTCNEKLLYYKKVGNSWNMIEEIEISKPISHLFTNYKDNLICQTTIGNLLYYVNSENRWEYLIGNEVNFNDFCLINPMGEHIVALCLNIFLNIIEVSSGITTSTLTFPYKALAIGANPTYPYIGVTFAHGLLQLISVRNPELPTVLAQFRLSRSKLNSIYFTEIGNIIVTADTETGQFFIIEGTPGSKMDVVAIVNVGHQIVDYILAASRTCLRLFAVCVTADLFIAGNRLLRYCITKKKSLNPDVKEYEITDKNLMYKKIYATTRDDRDRIFYAVPFSAREIHKIETKRSSPTADIIDQIPTDHKMRNIQLQFTNHNIISYSYDGLAIIYTIEFKEVLATIMPHHRIDGGIYRAFVDPYGKYIITLGRDNILVCHALNNVEIDQEKRQELINLLSEPECEQIFENATTGCQPTGDESKTWFEIKAIKKEQRERIECKTEREKILQDFKNLQTIVQELLTANIEGPENEILDVQEFNVDEKLKDEKISKSKERCEYTRVYLESLIVAQNKIANWITEYCWNGMFVQGKTIRALFENFEVHNYTLLPPNGELMEHYQLCEEYRKLEKYLSNIDSFQPWIPQTKSELEVNLSKLPKLTIENTKEKNMIDLLGEEEQVAEVIDHESITAYNGSVSHLYIDLSICHYTQQQLQTFFQTKFQTRASMHDMKRLKETFNKKFEDLVQLKMREMNNVTERNARLRYIISELEFFAKESLDITIFDAEWTQKEQPERIIKTEDKEVAITPYISPSQQAILDEKAAEAERIRLALLADDFRERALMAMMNGVLEIRWEDELKKDVPKPKCLLTKDPMNYDQDDLRAIRDYEEKVKILNGERDKYKRMLETEYARLSNVLREGVKKFNLRLSDLNLTKIKVDSGIGHENLLVHRNRLKNHHKNLMNLKEKQIEENMLRNDAKIKMLHELLGTLHGALNQCKNEVDSLQIKEKQLEKLFKKDFSQTSSAVQEQAARIYKKRPRILLRTVTSVTVMRALAISVISRENSPLLNSECIEFLKSIDNLDLFVGILPPIDEHMFSIICKHRRARIELEIKLKAALLETGEGEATISYFQKSVSRKKEYNIKLIHELGDVRELKIFHAQNMEVQLVLKQGLVEIPTTGKLGDFHNAVMIGRKEVEAVNNKILRAGRKKLKALQDTIDLHRDILIREWEHKRLRMIIEDLKTQIYHIQQVKVTKEIQSYLKSKARGDSPDKGLSFEQEVDLLKASYQRLIDERKSKIRDMDQQIQSIHKENKFLNKKISAINVDVCEFQQKKDPDLEQRAKDVPEIRMKLLVKRSKLVKLIQQNHSDILIMQTELEVLRQKTYPILEYKILQN